MLPPVTKYRSNERMFPIVGINDNHSEVLTAPMSLEHAFTHIEAGYFAVPIARANKYRLTWNGKILADFSEK